MYVGVPWLVMLGVFVSKNIGIPISLFNAGTDWTLEEPESAAVGPARGISYECVGIIGTLA